MSSEEKSPVSDFNPVSDFDFGLASMESHPNMATYLYKQGGKGNRADMMDMIENKMPSHLDFDPSMMGTRHELPPEYLEDMSNRKLGTFDGVFMYVAVSVFGVVLFARMGWMVAYAGLGLSLLIVCISAFVTLVTNTSVSALVTNGKVGAGGPYFLVARSVGMEFGCVVGIMYALAQVVTIALNDVGFAEGVVALYDPGFFTGSHSGDVMVIGQIANLAMLLCCWLGVEWVNSANNMFMGSILIGISSFIVGTFYRPVGHVPGYTSYNGETLRDNVASAFTNDISFFTVFGVFFPAVTGVLQGANLTAELKDPGKSIPFGTAIAIIFCSIVYCIVLIICAATGKRSLLMDFEKVDFEGVISVWSPLVTQGLYSAALSTSVGMLMGAPRVLIATLEDGFAVQLFPEWLRWLCKLDVVYEKDPDTGKDKIATEIDPVTGEVRTQYEVDPATGERREKRVLKSADPMRGYVVCTLIACVVTFFGGSLNAISPIVSNLYMMVYGIINLACFLADHFSSPGWRPQFRYFNKWLALVGAALCVGSMFVIDYTTGTAVLVLSLVLYKWVEFKKPRFSGGAMESAAHLSALRSVINLEALATDAKNFRPSFLVLANARSDVPFSASADFVVASRALQMTSMFYKSHSLVMQARILVGDVSKSLLRERAKAPTSVAVSSKITAFNKTIISQSMKAGVSSLLQTSGLGKIAPNTVVLEFPEDWVSCSDKKLQEFVDIITTALMFEAAVVIVRAPNLKFDEHAVHSGNIDVHWMVDDGGMTLLLAHLLIKSSPFSNCKLRVFVPDEEEEKQLLMNRIANNLTFNAHTMEGEKFKAQWESYLAKKGIKLMTNSSHSVAGQPSSASKTDANHRPSVMTLFGDSLPSVPSSKSSQPSSSIPPSKPSSTTDVKPRVQSKDDSDASYFGTFSRITESAWNILSGSSGAKKEKKEAVSELSQLMRLLRIRAKTFTVSKSTLTRLDGQPGSSSKRVETAQLQRVDISSHSAQANASLAPLNKSPHSKSAVMVESLDMPQSFDEEPAFLDAPDKQSESVELKSIHIESDNHSAQGKSDGKHAASVIAIFQDPQSPGPQVSSQDISLNKNPLFGSSSASRHIQFSSAAADSSSSERRQSGLGGRRIQSESNLAGLLDGSLSPATPSVNDYISPTMASQSLSSMDLRTASAARRLPGGYQSPILSATADYADMVHVQSEGSAAIFITIPVPRAAHHPPREYLRCLDALSNKLCQNSPVMFVRGNNQTVLKTWL